MKILLETVAYGRTKNHLLFKGFVPTLDNSNLYTFDYTGVELSSTASMTDEQLSLLLHELKGDFGYAPFDLSKASSVLGTGLSYELHESVWSHAATPEQKKIDRLSTLLERVEEQGDSETVSALRWAIFELENKESKL